MLTLFGTTPAHAQTEWTGAGDGTSWSDPENWSTGAIPSSGNDVVIDARLSTNYVVTVDDNYEIASLVLNAGQATLQLNGPLLVTSTAEHRAGRIDGPQTLTVGETLTWSNGVAAGEGVTDVGTLVLTSSAVKTLDGRQLVMSRGGQFVDGYNFHGRNGGELVIGGDATFDLSTTNNYRLFYYDGTGARPTITNQGRFRKIQGTTGRIDMDWALTNSRLFIVNQEGAHVALRGPIADNDGVYRADAGRLDFSAVGETVTFGSNSRIAGAGIVDFSGGTFDVNGTVEVTGTTEVSGASGQGANVTFPSTMTLTSWGNLTVRDRGSLDLQLTSLPALQDFALDFESTLQLAAPLTVQGTYTQVNATSTLRTSETVTVEGAMAWTGGTITGGGTVEARGGVTIGGAGASAGNVKRLDNTRLVVFDGTTATHLGWYFFGGNGAVLEVQSGATLSVEGTQAFRPFQVLGGSTAAPILENQGTVEVVSPFEGLLGIDWALVNGGTVRVNQANAHLRFNGAVTDQDGRYQVPSGRLDFSAVGETYAFGPASLFEGGGVLEFSGGTITVNGTYNVTGTTEISGAAGQGASVTFPSTMTLQALGGTLLRVHDRSSLDIQTSTIPDVGRLEIGFQGTLALASALRVTGGMALENASARFISDQDLIVDGPIAWQGGYLEGAGTTTANGGITFSGGAGSASWNKGLRTGHTLVIPTGTTAEYVGTRAFDGSNGSTIRIEEGALFDLQDWADLVVPSGSDSAPRLINNGTFRKSGGTSGSRINWPLTNSGVVEVGVDLLNLRERITDQNGIYRTTAAGAELRFEHRGEGFDFAEGATLSGPGTMHFYQEGAVTIFGTYDVTGRSKFSGNGTSLRADVTFDPTMNLVSLGVLDLGTDFGSGGIARIETADPLTVPSLSLGGSGQLYLTPDLTVNGDASLGNAGTLLTGPSTLTVEGALTWKGGTMAGTGRTVANGPVRFTGGAGSASWNKTLAQRSFVLQPGVTATYEGTRNFAGRDGALFYVQEGAMLDIQQWADFVVPTGSSEQPILRNEGTVRKSGGDSDTRLLFDLENAGVLEVTNDVLDLLGTMTNTGRIQGTATLDVTQISGTNNGIIAPGLSSPGLLTFDGGLPFEANAALEVEVGGTTPGTEHDQLVVTGPASLGGTLDLSTINGYTPASGDAFTILTAGEVQGQFDAINQPTDATFDVQYTGTSVELVATTNESPVAADDAAETLQETRVVIDVLANDSDPDDDPLQVSSVSLPSNGKVAILAAGVEYTPEPGFTGEDTFTYVVSDGRGGTDEAAVTVTVTPATGTLSGTVFDSATETRIVGAQVQIPSLSLGATTDSNGNYSFTDVPTGTYDVTASLVGYRPSTLTVVVNTDQTTTANFFLQVDDGLVRWTGGGDRTSWSDPGNWDTGTVPAADEVAIVDLDAGTSFTVLVDGAFSVGELRLETPWVTLQVENRLDVNGALGLSSGTVSGPDSLVVGGGVVFTGGQINGAGTVLMNGGMTWTGGAMRGAGQTVVNAPSTVRTQQGFEDAGRPLYERTLTFTDTVTVEEGFLDTREGATVVVETDAVVEFPDDRTGIRPLEYTSPRPTLDNRGTIVKTGRGDSFYTSTLGYQEDTFRGDESITILNTGVIRSEVGTLTVYVAEDTDVGGVVEATANGRMNFFRARFSSDAQLGLSATVQGEGTFNFADAYRFTGTFDLAGTALLTGGQRFDESMTIQRAGTLQLRASRDGVFTFAAPNTPTIETFIVGGGLEQQSDFTVSDRFGFGSEGSATLSGTGTITVGPDAEMLWGPGRLGGSGTVDVQGRLTATVASYLAGDFQVQESEKWLDGRTMIVRGPATWDDATLNFDNGGFLDLREASVFDLQRDAIFQLGAQAVGEEGIRLAGQFVKSGVGRRTSTGSEPVAYDNQFYGATLAVPTQNEGIFSIEAGTVALQNATLTNTGVVQGTDTLDVSESDSFLDNQGTVGPGPSTSRLAVVGAFDNTDATLSIELAGTTAGKTHDQLVVQGAAVLGGVLDVAVVDPYDPPGGTEFVILTAGSLTGTFNTLNLPSLDGRTVEVETTDTEVRVRVVQTVTNADPVAVNDTTETTAGTSVIIDVLANDTDPDDDPLTISSVGTSANGTATIVAEGIEYTPNDGFVGDDAFTYTVSDGNGGTDQATVTVTVVRGNAAPVAEADNAETEANTSVAIDVLANDSDPDGDPLTVTGTGAPSNGTVSIESDGTIVRYTPAQDFQGEDSFSYQIADGRGGTAQGTVVVTVVPGNTPPVAADDVAATDAGTPVVIDVLANDTDADGDPLTVSEVGTPSNGTATSVDGGIEYTPTDGFSGEDTFTYVVSDGRGGTDEATVTVSVAQPNAPPVAADDSVGTEAGTAVVVDVLANDQDADGDVLLVENVGTPDSGTATLVDGGIEYTPDDGFVGGDAFVYTVADGNGGTDQATVTVTVVRGNRAPIAEADNAETEANTSVAIDVLANDSDPDGDPLTVTGTGAPSNGTVSIESDGTIVRYIPAQDFEGDDTFTYTISDGQGGSAEATVTVTVVAPNGAPVAEDDAATTDQDTAVRIAVLVNDADPDGDALRISSVGAPENGSAQVDADVIVYTPSAGFTGTDAFTYTVADARDATDDATVTVTVVRPNAPPVASDDAATTVRETPVTIDVLANDTDDDGDPLIVTVTAEPANGQAARVEGQRVRYIPAVGFTGTDTFRYRVDDGRGGADEAVVTVTVEDVRFTVTGLGTLGGEASRAVAINDEGEVVGVSLNEDGAVQGFRWRNGTTTALASPSFRPFALSDDGTVAGYVAQDSTVEAALLRADGQLARLGTLGGPSSVAYAINADGEVVGTAQQSGGEYRAFRWDGDVTSLGAFGGEQSEAFALSRTGEAAGTVVRNGRSHAWRGDAVLEGTGESRAYAVNGTGLTVGSALVNETVVARLWREGGVVDLGAGTGAWAEAYAVNDAGWVVGTTTQSIGASASSRRKSATAARVTAWRKGPSARLHEQHRFGEALAKQAAVASDDLRAFLWIDGEIRDLNDFIPPDEGWTLLEARHLNNRGQIVGTGLLDGAERAFLLTPTDNAPPTADRDRETVAAGSDHVIRVLDNDSDEDGDPLRLLSVSTPQLGQVELAPDSSALLYRAEAKVQGIDAFTYVVSDGAGTTARGTVELDVRIHVDPTSAPVLEPNAPNPVRGRTRIRYRLPQDGPVRLEVFDVLGRRRVVLVDERQERGAKDVWLDVRRWAAGTYFYRLQAGGTVQTQAMTVVR